MTDLKPLPNYAKALIEDGKLLDYALNPSNERGRHKARLFERKLGFTLANWRLLRDAIIDALPTCTAIPRSETDFGLKYTVVMPVIGPTGLTANVTTVWQYDRLPDESLSDAPRLVTLYLD